MNNQSSPSSSSVSRFKACAERWSLTGTRKVRGQGDGWRRWRRWLLVSGFTQWRCGWCFRNNTKNIDRTGRSLWGNTTGLGGHAPQRLVLCCTLTPPSCCLFCLSVRRGTSRMNVDVGCCVLGAELTPVVEVVSRTSVTSGWITSQTSVPRFIYTR